MNNIDKTYQSLLQDILDNGVKKQNIIQIDLISCKNWNECMKVIELITSGRVKIKVNEQIR
jgi:hypothetical protein